MIGPTQDRYYLDPDVHQKCEELRSNRPLFLVSSVRHWTKGRRLMKLLSIPTKQFTKVFQY